MRQMLAVKIGAAIALACTFATPAQAQDDKMTPIASPAQPNAIVLDGETRDVEGVAIYGLGDPYFVDERGAPDDDEEVSALVDVAEDERGAGPPAHLEPRDRRLRHRQLDAI